MGGRGGASGIKADSPEQTVRREANEFLRQNGLNRYDKISYKDYSVTAMNHYNKMQMDLQEGIPLKTRFSERTANEILSKIKEERLFNAKRILASDLSDKNAVKSYKTTEERLNKIEDYAKKKTKSKTKTSTTPTATHKFVNSFGEATTREITSTTYKRSQKRMQRDVERWMGLR